MSDEKTIIEGSAPSRTPGPRPGFAGQILRGLAVVFTSALLYVGLLGSGVLAGFGFELRYDSVILPFGLAVVFFLLARAPRSLAAPGLVLLSTGLCATVLSGVWTSAVSDLSVFAGLFPHSDACSYLNGSLHLLNNGELDVVTSRRPLSPAIWAVMLFICHGNIKVVLALVVFLAALALTLPVRAMIRTHGWAAGYMVFLALFLFYRRFIGTTLSEHVGLMLGCLAFALLWRSVRPDGLVPMLAGAFVLALALCARAGAFFVLPSLAVWIGWSRRGAARFSVKAFSLACIAIGVGFALNTVLLRSLGTHKEAFGNFSYSLYGLVHGEDWTQVIQDHPELRQLPETGRNQAIYELAIQRIIRQPTSLASGMLRAYWRMLFSSEGPYCFVRFALQRSIREVVIPAGAPAAHGMLATGWKYLQIVATQTSFLGFSLLAFAGLFFLLRFRGPESGLLLWAGGGILASAPFAPPWDADLMRVYAATMPFMLVFPAVGAVALIQRWSETSGAGARGDGPSPESANGLLMLALIVVPLVCLAPVLFKFQDCTASIPPETSADGKHWNVVLVPGSVIRLVSSGAGNSRVDRATVRRNMGVLALNFPERAAELQAALAPGRALAMGYERYSRSLRYLVLDEAQANQFGMTGTEVLAEPVRAGGDTIWWKIRPWLPSDMEKSGAAIISTDGPP